jgi:hypothetical protein
MIHTLIQSSSEVVDALTDFVPKLVMLASVLAALLPPPEEQGFLSKVHDFINKIALNVKHAKNKEDGPI